MSIYFYIFDKSSKRGLCLGRRLADGLSEYEGPIIYIDADRYFLPPKYLSLLIKRFEENKSLDDVVIVPEYELFDGDKLLAESDEFVEVGGDTGAQLLREYLPELNSESDREEIKRLGKKIS